MNAPHAVAERSSSSIEPDEELSLLALLDLCWLEEPAEAPAVERRPVDVSWDGLRTWARMLARRATEWGAGPRGSWRAW